MSALHHGQADGSGFVGKGSITISTEEILRTRESLTQGLSSISTAINEFVRSYIQHTNQWIGMETPLPAGVDIAAMSNIFASGATTADALMLPPTTAAADATPGKRGPYKKNKDRKKREKDPNAPKRPLTAYFLFSQTARDIVKNDFAAQGKTPAASDVSDEILRRWTSMNTEQRAPWKELYDKNAAVYRKDVEAYKAKTGGAVPQNVAEDEEEASPEASAGPSLPPAPIAPVAPSAPPAEKKTKAKSKKKDTPVAAQSSPSPSGQLLTKVSEVPVPGSSAAPTHSPAKGNKRKSDADKAAPSEEPAKKKNKRKSKAEREAEEAAAAAAATPVPAQPEKKRRKSKKDSSA